MTLIKKFLDDESGATAIEYGLIVGLIAVAIIGALTALGGDISELFTSVQNKIAGSTGSNSEGG